MTARPWFTALLCSAVFALHACGHYGPPVRSTPPAQESDESAEDTDDAKTPQDADDASEWRE